MTAPDEPCVCGHVSSEHLSWGGCLGGPLDDPTCDCAELLDTRADEEKS